MRKVQSVQKFKNTFDESSTSLKKSVSTVVELRMSPLPPPSSQFLYMPQDYTSKNPQYIKIPKAPKSARVEKDNRLIGIDKILHERFNPEYRNNSSTYKKYRDIQTSNIHKLKNDEIKDTLAKLDDRKNKFVDRYKKLFKPAPDTKASDLKTLRVDLADLRVPRNKGYTVNFYKSIKEMLEKVD